MFIITDDQKWRSDSNISTCVFFLMEGQPNAIWEKITKLYQTAVFLHVEITASMKT